MKATCLKKYFKEAVGLCEKISGKNLSLPVLSNILIDTGDNELKLSATNLELGIEIKIPAKIGKKGKIAVPANIISGFLSTFSGEESVTLEAQNNNNLLVSTDSSSTIIKGQPTDDFPILPQNKLSNSFLVPVGEFVLGLKSVWYACSTSNVKPEISSVMVVVKEKNMTFAATDSFRLAEKKIKNKTGEYGPILIPYRTVAEIIRIFEGREGDVKISSDKNQLFMETEGVVFISRLMDGVFPDYQQIIPSKFSSDVVISKELFTNTLKTASVFSGKLCEVGLSFDCYSANMHICIFCKTVPITRIY